MKKIKLFSIIFLMCFSNHGYGAKKFKVKGRVLNNDVCNIIIMHTNDAGQWVEFDLNTEANKFKLKLIKGKQYKIYFKQENATKILEIKANKAKQKINYTVLVDFSTLHECVEVRLTKKMGLIRTKEINC